MSRTIQDLYEKYKVLPSLQLHHLRVAAVMKVICDNWTGPEINVDERMHTALLHDIANILKFDMTAYPDFFEPEGVEYRTGVKEWTKQFGDEEHKATLAMAKDAEVNFGSYTLLKESLYTYTKDAVDHDNYGVKALHIADMMVSPHGIVSRKQRINDLEQRNMKNHGYTLAQAQERSSGYRKALPVIIQQLQKDCPCIESLEEEAKKVSLDVLRNYLV